MTKACPSVKAVCPWFITVEVCLIVAISFVLPGNGEKRRGCLEESCSSSPYGRTVYTKTEDNPKILYGCPKAWNSVARDEPTDKCGRSIAQVLRDLASIENNGVRTHGRINLWITKNHDGHIHLKAQYKYRIHEQKEGK